MNVAYFLTPKSQVVWVSVHGTLEQALERMRPHGYSAVPMLDEDGRYVGILTEGDILWHLLDQGGDGQRVAKKTPIRAVERRMQSDAIGINAQIEMLITRAAAQSFVPVVDDRDVFIGIVRRAPIIEHYSNLFRALAFGDGGDERRNAAQATQSDICAKPPTKAQNPSSTAT